MFCNCHNISLQEVLLSINKYCCYTYIFCLLDEYAKFYYVL